jgi:hypothetical protein
MIIMLTKKKDLNLVYVQGTKRVTVVMKKTYFYITSVKEKKISTFKTRKSNVSHIVPGHHYVSKFVPHSACCLSECKTSAKELAAMPAFHQAVIGFKDKSTSAQVLKCIVAEEYKKDNLTCNVIQRSRNIVCDNDDLRVLNSYSELVTFLSLVEKHNPGSRACYQLDDKGRFYRCF